MIEELKKHLQSVGKTDESWLDLAKRFNILPNGTNKQRSDKVRKIWNSIKQEILKQRNTPNSYQTYYPLVPSEMYTYSIDPYNNEKSSGEMFCYHQNGTAEHLKQEKEWNEFRKWKEGKVQTNTRKKDGINIVISCLHVPYENKELVIKLCSFIQDNKDKIVGFHLIGDYLDLRIAF